MPAGISLKDSLTLTVCMAISAALGMGVTHSAYKFTVERKRRAGRDSTPHPTQAGGAAPKAD